MSDPAGDWIDELVDASLARGLFTRDENGNRVPSVTPRRMVSVTADDPWGDDHRNCSVCRGKFVPEQ